MIPHFLRLSRNAQRRNVLLLALTLCLWMIMSAAHIHAGEAHTPGQPSTACSTCASLSTGATAPAQYELPARAQGAGVILLQRAAPSIAFTVPSSYLSRAPPAV